MHGGTASAQTVFPAANPNTPPTQDAFYISPSAAELGNLAPGTVLRQRSVPNVAYPGLVSEMHQLMYRSTDGRGQPVASVTTVLVPIKAPPTGRRLLSYQAYYDSLTLNCSPSSLTATGRMFEKLNLNRPLDEGVVVALPDYEGLQSQLFAGPNAGRAVLDGIRAVAQFERSGLSARSPVALYGYSGGGHATAWANEQASSYAPELNIVGAAQGSVVVDLVHTSQLVDGGFFAGIAPAALVGLSRAHPEFPLDAYLTAEGKAMVKDIGQRCFLGTLSGQPEIQFDYMYKRNARYVNNPDFLKLPAVAALYERNKLGQQRPKAPVFMYQGVLDGVVPVTDVDALVQRYCASGQAVSYLRPLLGSHLILGAFPGPMMDYALDRLKGLPAPDFCAH